MLLINKKNGADAPFFMKNMFYYRPFYDKISKTGKGFV